MGKNILVLSGGGSNGDFQAGVITKLYRQGYRADAIAGISVGNLNGVMTATGGWDRLDSVWRNISPGQVFNKRSLRKILSNNIAHRIGVATPYTGFYNCDPLRETIKNNFERHAQFKCDFYTGTVNIETMEYHEFHAKPGYVPWNYLDQIMASAAIPVVFEAVRYRNGELHVDGGVRHQIPLGRVIEDHIPDHVTVIPCKTLLREEPHHKRVRDIVDMAKRTLDTLLQATFEDTFWEMIRINRLVAQAEDKGVTLHKPNGQPYRRFKVSVYQPEQDLGDSMNFSAKKARRNLEIGYNTQPTEVL